MIKDKTLMSIIMNCHNGEKYLYKSISSVISQSYKNWELIFWDNNSTDTSEKIVRKFNDSRIKIYKSNNFIKLYKARNLAIEKAHQIRESLCPKRREELRASYRDR
mgnify:CR=1 FL=1